MTTIIAHHSAETTTVLADRALGLGDRTINLGQPKFTIHNRYIFAACGGPFAVRLLTDPRIQELLCTSSPAHDPLYLFNNYLVPLLFGIAEKGPLWSWEKEDLARGELPTDILIADNSSIYVLSKGPTFFIAPDFYAIGSGAKYAQAAWLASANMRMTLRVTQTLNSSDTGHGWDYAKATPTATFNMQYAPTTEELIYP